MEFVKVISLTFSTLSHATEDKKKVLEAISRVCFGNVSAESKFGKARGHYGNEILSLKISVRSPAQADRLFHELWSRLRPDDRGFVQSHLAKFIDTSGTLFLRIDKEESYRRNIFLGGTDTIKIEARFGAREIARSVYLMKITELMKSIHQSVER